ncbi:MAG: ABC transporter ATP-binding protein [Anaerolineae bacterium]|nr:ABC transporter ATP-binding protein [Anaerolineae bacterium]MCA9888906.1 ABC transporter ATP-binding protein [Anaerolineae bacterium]MCA9895002.1 ABC transporter ATP-binding protein [Anaerolineae bacterium]
MIAVESLHAGYGKLQILHDINLTFHQNRFTAVLGANGSGKSTLMKSIFGLTQIFGGAIRFDDRNLVGMPTEAISKLGLAYVPQRENIFTDLSIRENLLLSARQLAKDDARIAMEQTYDMFPILAKRERQRAGQLSGGERQMLAIAIAWLTRPAVMLLDEPSAGLAPLIANEVFEILQTLCDQGMTFVVVEQNARRILQYCDEVYILREGQLAFSGTAQECLADEETVKGYLGVH